MFQRRKAVFIDKDGTLIPDIPYNVNPDLITLNEGVIEGLQSLKDAGFIFVLISNQSGVARGLFQFNELEKVSEKLEGLLKDSNLEFSGYYYCPHHSEGTVEKYSFDCECRKPKPGMLLQAADDLQIELESSWMIGDILNDCEAGNRAGCNSILINNNNETEWLTGPFRRPTYIAADFKDAADYIIKHDRQLNRVDERQLASV